MAQQTIGIAITTAPRPRPTLRQSLKSLRQAGFEQQILVFSDDPEPDCDGSVLINNPPLGNLHNFDRALRWLVGMGTKYILVIEDDVIWAEGSAAALDKDLELLDGRLFGYLSLYLPRQVAWHIAHGHKLSKGLHCSRLGMGTWGAQALCFPQKAAKRLLNWKAYQEFLTKNHKHRDSIVADSFRSMGMERFYRVPCLVNHELGFDNSTLTPRHYRRRLLETDYWTGTAC